MRIRPKISLFHYFHLVSFVLFIICAFIFFALNFYNARSTFERKSDNLRDHYIETQKGMLIAQVDRFTEHVIKERNKAYARTQKLIQMRVNRAHDIATQIYEKYKQTHDQAFIQQKIVDALRLLRYENGYYFITRDDGVEILYTDRPEMEGLNMLHLDNDEMKTVVAHILAIAKNEKEGFYDYSWQKTQSNVKELFRKIAYVKLFEPYGWVLGTGIYLEDIEKELKEELASDEQRLMFDKESGNYIFIGTWDGVSIAGPNQGKNIFNVRDSNGKYLVQELVHKAKEGGGFVEYVAPDTQQAKMSYVVPLHGWEWYVGSGIYVKNVNEEIAKLRDAMLKEMQRTFFTIALWLIVFSALVWISYLYVSRKISKDFDLFIDFFDSLVKKDQFINTQNVRFLEFEELAKHANEMLKAKIFSNKHLAVQKNRLQFG